MTLEKIGTCFGMVDGIFAGHYSEGERALEELAKIKSNNYKNSSKEKIC